MFRSARTSRRVRHRGWPGLAAAAAALATAAVTACSGSTSPSPAQPPATATSSEPATAARPVKGATMRVQLTVGNATATATLHDNPTARDLAWLLPVTLRMSDLLGREKPGALPRPLAGGTAQATYQAGDLGYWSPGHDLAIYYRDDGERIPAPGIVIIGHIDTGLPAIADAGDNFQLRITALD